MLPYFDEEPLLKPSNLIKERGNIPKTIIITWQKQILIAIDKKYGCSQISTFRCGLSCPVYSFKVRHDVLGIALLPIGAPVAAGFIEEYAVRGATRFVAVGYAGSLNPITQNNIVVPTHAYRDEGTSMHYAPQDNPWIPVQSAQKLDWILDDLEVPHVCGKVWSTDAFYRETPSAVKAMKEQNVLCVDMECAANMAVSQYLGIECLQFFFAADRLEKDIWEVGKLKSLGSSAYEKFSEIAIRVALSK